MKQPRGRTCREVCKVCGLRCAHKPGAHPVHRAVDAPHRRYSVHHCSLFSNHGHCWIVVYTRRLTADMCPLGLRGEAVL